MAHHRTLIPLTLALLLNLFFSQSPAGAYRTLYREHLPVIRSREFGATNGPDSEIFDLPLFCLQCEGQYCEHHYLLALNNDNLSAATRARNEKTHDPSTNSTTDNFSTVTESGTSMASEYALLERQRGRRLTSVRIGREGKKRGICNDQERAKQVSYEPRSRTYTIGCGRSAENLRNDPSNVRERRFRPRPLAKRTSSRQASSVYQRQEALCDDGYYIWGMACADSDCDTFIVVCIRVLFATNSDIQGGTMETGESRVCNARVCCPLSCGICGGTGCSSRDGGQRNCCESNIRLFSSVCSGPNDSPCVLSPESLIATPIDSSNFQYCEGRVCCAPSCGVCGGPGCSSRNGGASNCCTSHITASGKICRGNEDLPCLLPESN